MILDVCLNIASELSVDFGSVQQIGGDNFDPYLGEYEVTPTPKGFTLPTNQKLMKEDLTVREIPYFETSNTSGGKTVYIGTSDEISITKKEKVYGEQ